MPTHAPLPPSRRRGSGARSNGLVGLAIVVTALNLRTSVTSVGPLLDEVQRGVGLSTLQAGMLTSLPVLSFAVLGWFTPSLARRVGEHRALFGALLLMTVGLALRPFAGGPAAFLLLSVLALAGGAMGNVVLPILVKRHFPDRIGAMTGAYTTALAVGTTLAAAATVPVSQLGGGDDWRLGLGVWAALAALSALPWLALVRQRERAWDAAPDRHASRMLRSRTAWALALFFGSQSLQAYVAFGWFALFYREQAALSAARAGLLVAFLAALSIPVSLLVPWLAARASSQRPLVVCLVSCSALAYTGMLLAPGQGAWLWALLAGTGAGAFPLSLTLVGLRARTPAGTASLSAFSQSVGYLVAAGGPLLFGVLRGATGGWGAPFALLYAALVVLAVTGWYVGQPRYVEDDLPSAAAAERNR